MSADYRSFTPNITTGLEDASAGADAHITRLATLLDGNASLTMRGVSGGSATWAALAPQTAGTLHWAPEGTAGANYKINAIVESVSSTLAYAGVTEWSVTWQFSSTTAVALS